MRGSSRILLGASVVVAFAVGAVLWVMIASTNAVRQTHAVVVPTVSVLYGSAPDFLDPQESYTTQGEEALWVSYLGLYTYAHGNGAAGSVVIPALATAQPQLGDGGKTYTMTLRKHLVYSNGAPVKASDFTYSIKRALKLNWGGDSFYTGNIVGAAAYAAGKSTTISGITTDDATGTITIHLLAPFGAFENVLAFPSSGFVPSGTPMANMTNHPPPGVGPYKIADVVLGKSWVGAINPYYAKEAIPGIPQGSVTIDAHVESNTTVETENVLNNTADLFDTGDQIAPPLLAQIKTGAANRYSTTPLEETYYLFLNTAIKPFDSLLVREAVTMAVDRRAMARLDTGNLVPGCYFLPPGLVGHPTQPCPYGNPNAAPNLAEAKQLVARSGDKGASITVWSEQRQPKAQFALYYASVLSSLGFKVTIKPVADAQYYSTIGNLKLDPQTGFDDWLQDFPNPGDFYQNNLDARAIQPTNNLNAGRVNDPNIQKSLAQLYPVPAGQLATHAAGWQALDYYTAQKAYVVVIGYPVAPVFASSRIDYHALVVEPSYGWDWTSIRVNK